MALLTIPLIEGGRTQLVQNHRWRNSIPPRSASLRALITRELHSDTVLSLSLPIATVFVPVSMSPQQTHPITTDQYRSHFLNINCWCISLRCPGNWIRKPLLTDSFSARLGATIAAITVKWVSISAFLTRRLSLHCFNTVGWATGRASGL